MKKHFVKIAVILIFMMSINAVIFAQECNENMAVDTPNERFENLSDGTILDKNTSLIWKMCAEGQTYNFQSGSCDGEARLFVYNDALAFVDTINSNSFAGHTDWRVPNIKELSSIVESSCVMPAINVVIFRNHPNGMFRSSTPAGSTFYCMNFGNGIISIDCSDPLATGGMGAGMGPSEIYEGFLRFVRN